MNKNRQIEVLVGAFMAIGFAALFVLAMKVSNLGTAYSGNSYEVTARFDNIGGLKVKAPVTMAGVEVGRVREIYYDAADYRVLAGAVAQEQAVPSFPDPVGVDLCRDPLLGARRDGGL